MEHFIGKYAVLLPYMEGVWNNTPIKVAIETCSYIILASDYTMYIELHFSDFHLLFHIIHQQNHVYILYVCLYMMLFPLLF